jgi:PKD repeat protein
MKKETTLGHRKIVLLILAGFALLTSTVHAQTVTTAFDELILGFYATGAPGQTLNLEVDLGNMSNFYNTTGSIPLPALAVQDLVDTYGASWSTRTDLFWGAVSTTGRAVGTADGHAPVGTLWGTAPEGATAFNRGSVFAQKAASPNIEGMVVAGGAGSLLGAPSTTNSASAAIIDDSLADNWTAQDLKSIGTSFGYFVPTVDNTAFIPLSGQVVSELYELQPTNASGVAGTLLGQLILTQSGLSFQAGGVVAPPVAGFSASPTNGAAPLFVTFTDASTGSITSSQWTFGDGGTSTATSPSYSYTNAGVFSVSLQVIGPGGSSTQNVVNLITVTDTNAPPTTPVLTIVSPTDFQTFASASLVVTGTATDASGILGVTINGTAATLTGTNWSGPVTLALGTNLFTVIATDNSANTATQVVHAVLAPVSAPVADFNASPTNGAAPLLVNFTDTSTGSITSWSWTFGDSGTSTATSPSHSYTNAGVFSVSLQVIGPGGSNTLNLVNLITVTTNIILVPPALTIVSPTDFQTFTNASLVVTGTVSDISAILGVTVNGTAATLSGANWSEPVTLALGTNVLTVIATDNSANTATQVVHAVLIPVPPPVAGFTASPTNGAAPLLVNFTDASTGSITNHSWTFGDGAASTATNPSHTYTNAGVFNVSLQVSGPGGSSISNRVNLITVTNTNAPPAPPVLTILSPTDGQSFTNASLLVAGTASDTSGILGVTVNGAAATLSGTNWSETVTLALGTNALTVIATDNSANTATQVVHAVLAPSAPVIVSAPSITNALLSVQNTYVVIAGETNVFNVGAIDNSGLPLSYQWQFGDGATNSQSLFSTAQHAYAVNNCGPVTASVTVSAGGISITSNLTVAVACQLAVSKVQAKLNFAKADSDGYNLTAVAQLSPDFLTTGQTLALDIGRAQETFTLDSKGRGVNEQGTCRLAFSKATKKRAAVWTITIKLSHGDFRDAWAVYGLTNTTTNDASVELPVVLMIGDEAFADDTLLLYTAKSGKSGTGK